MQHSMTFGHSPFTGHRESLYDGGRSTTCRSTSVYIKHGEPIPDQTIDRERFDNKREFLFSLIGKVVGPGNMWRFPYLVYKNGGASFILCYTVATILIGIPIAFFELALGQFSGKDCVRVFDFNPAFRGVGFTMCLVSMTMALYFHVIMAYIIHYFLNSFQHPLPWNVCRKSWKDCFTDFADLKNLTLCGSMATEKVHKCYCDEALRSVSNVNCIQHPKHAAEYYFVEVVTGHHITAVHERAEYGMPSWELSVILMGSWLFVTLCMSRGIRYTSKVVYVTVLSPYLGFLFIIIRGAMLDGGEDGMKFMFHAYNWGSISTLGFWVDAVGQAVIGLSAGLGSNFMFGSYNHFNNKVHRDILIVTVVDFVTNLLAATSVFLVLGYKAKRSGLNVNRIIKEDMGMVFVAYPSALVTLPESTVWSIIFFLVLYMLAIDTEFGNIETVLTYLQDDYRWIRRNNLLARYLTGLIGFLLSLFFVTPVGMQIITIIDYSLMANVVPFVCFLELAAIFWVYGFQNFVSDMEVMLDVKVRCKSGWFVYCGVILPYTCRGTSEARGWQGVLSYVLFYIFIAPILIWFVMHVKATARRTWKFGKKRFFRKLLASNRRWGPNDGTYVHRDVDSVFADVIPSMRRRKPRRERTISTECPFTPVDKSILCVPEVGMGEVEQVVSTKDFSFATLSTLPVEEKEEGEKALTKTVSLSSPVDAALVKVALEREIAQ